MRKLTPDELRACARGCVQTRETGGALQFLRFGDAALKYYAQREGWEVRSRCPAGVRLDFFTDADVVRVRADLLPGARKCGYFDLYAGGIFTGTLGAADAPDRLEGELPCGPAGVRERRRVELWLPHARPTLLHEVALPDGASFEPAPVHGAEMLFLGDSITQGMDATHPSFGYAMTATRARGCGHFNYGIGGAVFDAESLPEAPLAEPQGIVVAYGTNDWSSGLSTERARDYLKRVSELWPRTPVAVLEPLWRTAADGSEGKPNKDGQTLAAYRLDLARVVAALEGMTYIGWPDLLPPGPAFLVDGVHPGDTGHVVYGQNLAAKMRP
ncbi:MAG: SGNH/GDSL hydrolase family protein [Planctomycetes bacterium]|nr:SGNH/GDSL hydrolase family protein [Planctomycetota bacterium]